jgi:hypothetical protein
VAKKIQRYVLRSVAMMFTKVKKISLHIHLWLLCTYFNISLTRFCWATEIMQSLKEKMWSHQESNLDLEFRKLLFYPLNYETADCFWRQGAQK